MGDLLKVKSMKGNWVSLELPDRRKGYLTASETMNYHQWKKTLKPTPELILKTAKQFLGVPYLWGGTSSKGVDCSGFVKTVFRMNGIELTRDADQQGMQGDNVPIDENFQNIKPGDLLFFGARAINGKPERITHVAISLGGTEYIHSSGMVKYNSFDSKSPKFSESLKRKLVKVRRILGTSAAPGPAR
jgi:cell wall-associated NlpC family hydrolase